MSRSASDATRFTATGPHAHSKPSAAAAGTGAMTGTESNPQPSSSSQQPSSSPKPRQETPKEKVERLRAQARAERIKRSTSLSDRVVERGRKWADRAHRFTVFTLIAASGVAGALTLYSMGSLMIHTRRQRALFIEKEMQSVIDAKHAYVSGTATSEQLALLEKQKIADEEKRQRDELKKQGYLYKARQWVLGGLKKDEGVAVEPTPDKESASQSSSVLGLMNKDRDESPVIPDKKPSPESSVKQQGQTDKQASGSKWTSWIMGR